jgi:aminopeptidase-like protein
MQELIEKLYPINAYLLGEGYDKRLEILKGYLDLEVLEFKSGEQHGTWTIPQEWIIKEAWVKFNGEKIIDFDKEPLSILIGSSSFKGIVSREELLKHIYFVNDFGDNAPDTIPYKTAYYDDKWGFCATKNLVDSLEEGDYEVFIDTEKVDGTMKIATHTIKGKSKKEILLFAHLDHPYQANDNLSAVACLVEVAKKIKSKYTIKLVFCPETIGSNVYVNTQDLSNVEFVVAVDICGNDDPILMQKSWDVEHRINRVANCAFQLSEKSSRKGKFRTVIGSDESAFNDPDVGIAGIMLSTFDYDEYHTNLDTPDKIVYSKIEEVRDLIISMIDIYERDFIPKKNYKGQLMRSKYGFQSSSKLVNLNMDYFFYSIDGKKTLVELCSDYEQNFNNMYDIIERIIKDEKISRIDIGKK